MRPAGELSGSDEERETRQTRSEPCDHDAVRPAAVLDPVEDRHPDRHAGDDQRGEAGGHALLGPE